jgi:uncharacterized protein YkwD
MTPRGLLKGIAAAAAVACALAAPAAGARAGTESVRAEAALERGLLAEINGLRARRGLAPLRLNRRLGAAADAHSLAMARRGFFAHESADGSAFWKRVKRFYSDRGFSRWTVGENLLWSSPSIDPAAALKMWLDSPPHRRNLLSSAWREIGLSAVHVTAAPGVFGGNETTIVTADFGTRA